MRSFKVVLILSLTFKVAVTTVSAQRAGDIISGVVRDVNGPIHMANIVERDSAYRIVTHAVSNLNGEFSLKLVNPADRLEVTFVGYNKVDTCFSANHFEITLTENEDLPMVDILVGRRQETGPLPIPRHVPGMRIKGVVMDNYGPMLDVYVTEIDSESMVKAWTTTDYDGKFQFTLINPNDSIRVSYQGYYPVVVPVERYIEIKMEEVSKNPSVIIVDGEPGSLIPLNSNKPIEPIDTSRRRLSHMR